MVTYSYSFLDFLQGSRCRIAKTLYAACYTEHAAYRLMLTTDGLNYLSIRPGGTISYLPAGKPIKYNADGKWAIDGRQHGKPARVIRKLFTQKALKLFTDKDFEDFANAYKCCAADRLKFELRKNELIPSVYNMSRANGDGSLNTSCMNGDGRLMGIYKACAALRILILLDENNDLCGRALVWSLDDNITLLDRIYVVSDFMYDLFINYAIEKGWWYKKEYRSCHEKDLFINDKGEFVSRKFTVYTPTDFEEYPYIDTFTYGNNRSLNNYNHGCYTYEQTDGTRDGDLWDGISGGILDPDDAVDVTHGQQRGRTTHIDHTVDLDGQIWWEDDPALIWLDGECYRREDTVWSEYDDAHYLNADCVWSEVHESYILLSESISLGGKIYHTDAAPNLERA